MNRLMAPLYTRERTPNFVALGLVLPNPDPILKAQRRDIEVYRNLCSDALVGSCIRRRKSAVKALEWGLDRGQSTSRVAKAVQAMLDALDLQRIIGQMLDCTLYGYQPMEVIWRTGSLWVPTDVVAKPPEWFFFDAANALRFRSKEQPLYGEPVPAQTILLARQDPTYQNPYGFADLSMVFWPLTFKKGSLKFWLTFAEKWGSAFVQGKLPRSATPAEKTELLDSLEALIQNGVAVIPDDGSIAPLELAGKAASADLYEKLVLHCRSEISIALLGQNQTTEASANKASASAGLEVGKDLRDGDAAIVTATLNELIDWVCQKNFGDVPRPLFSMWDQAAQDELQAARDKSNYSAGARFTNAYWQRAYGYQEGDLAEPAPTPVGAALAANAPAPKPRAATTADPNADPTDSSAEPPPSFAEPAAAPDAQIGPQRPIWNPVGAALAAMPPAAGDAIDALVQAAQADWQPVLHPTLALLQRELDAAAQAGVTASELLARLPGLLAQLDAAPLADALTQAAFTAHLAGQAGLPLD